MRKVFLAGMLVAGLSTLIISCNNGDYNAAPDRNTDIYNPLNPSTGVTVALGTVKAALNGNVHTFVQSAGWTDTSAGSAVFQAFKYDNAHVAEFMGGTLSPYGNVMDYPIADTLSNDFYYGVMDTNDHIIYNFYQAHVAGGNMGDINLKGNESNRLRGTFTTTLFKMLPVMDMGDMIQVTDGEFYVKKY